jgi:hypothetical protein
MLPRPRTVTRTTPLAEQHRIRGASHHDPVDGLKPRVRVYDVDDGAIDHHIEPGMCRLEPMPLL